MRSKDLITAVCVAITAVQAFTKPCVYQSYKCGFNLVNDNGTQNLDTMKLFLRSSKKWMAEFFVSVGYTMSELSRGLALTPSIPQISGFLLLQVLYRCVNTDGVIAGNSICFGGCLDMGGELVNDQCSRMTPK